MLLASGSLVVKIIEVASDTLCSGLRLSVWGQQEDYWVLHGDYASSKERTSMTQQSLVGHDLIIIEASRSHSDMPHLAGLLWTRDQPDAKTSIWQHTIFKRDRHIWLGGIRTRNPKIRAAAKLRLRSRGYWVQQRTDWFAELKKLKSCV